MALARELSVGEVAKRTGVAVSTLHFYESKGLISSYRDSANHRRYHRDILRKISVIRIAQQAGIQLREIKAALASIPGDKTVTPKDWERLSTTWRQQLNDRIDQLTDLRDNLDTCIGCGCLSMKHCRLANPNDILGEDSPGPHIYHGEPLFGPDKE
ncbi:redox-sensitive transcriptional activator SoxR [Thalassomonas viridans]|uniref:Redox-sensitive transcriptional activator SoxR n=1 Tax=Thalassomonas viridans TaxID=137584 RepID=A0AAE9ZE52_9GAMM|nr:redox-sensitive transcriptional activator SoxR [Thalassomonas viridans]WDE08732.1 redox-sensitive transcriptional activator SoxR [Thalassomonas viridans]